MQEESLRKQEESVKKQEALRKCMLLFLLIAALVWSWLTRVCISSVYIYGVSLECHGRGKVDTSMYPCRAAVIAICRNIAVIEVSAAII